MRRITCKGLEGHLGEIIRVGENHQGELNKDEEGFYLEVVKTNSYGPHQRTGEQLRINTGDEVHICYNPKVHGVRVEGYVLHPNLTKPKKIRPILNPNGPDKQAALELVKVLSTVPESSLAYNYSKSLIDSIKRGYKKQSGEAL